MDKIIELCDLIMDIEPSDAQMIAIANILKTKCDAYDSKKHRLDCHRKIKIFKEIIDVDA